MSRALTSWAVAACALLCTSLALWIAQVLLGGVAHVFDEATYVFQAEILRRLTLSAPLPPLGGQPPFTVVQGDRIFGIFPNGWPALLMVAHRLGLPYNWLNPLLGALLVWRGALLAGRTVSPAGADRGEGWAIQRRTILLTALFLALSPQLLLLDASMMGHTIVALCWVLAWDQVTQSTSTRRALWLGACIGLCFLVRPLCGTVLGVCCLVVSLRPFKRWLWAAIPVSLALILQFVQNFELTGNVFSYPADVFFDGSLPSHPGCNHLGFGLARGCSEQLGWGHDLRKAWFNTAENLRAWFWLLLGPGLVFLPFLGLRNQRARPRIVRWLAATLLLIASYALYWYQGTCYGARFYHGAAPLLIIAAGVGVACLPGRLLRVAAAGVVVLGEVFALGKALPELEGYWGLDGRFARLQADWNQPPAAVLIDPVPAPNQTLPPYRLTGPSTPVGVVPPDIMWEPYLSPWPDARVWLGIASADNLQKARSAGRDIWLYHVHLDAREDTIAHVSVDNPSPDSTIGGGGSGGS
jgi:hypothetical protein